MSNIPTILWSLLTFSTLVYGKNPFVRPSEVPACNCVVIFSSFPELSGTYWKKPVKENYWEANNGKNIHSEKGQWVINSAFMTAVYDDCLQSNTPPVGPSKWSVPNLDALVPLQRWLWIICDECHSITRKPTGFSKKSPTYSPTGFPTATPSELPTATPTYTTTISPTDAPSKSPTATLTEGPTETPTHAPTKSPTFTPTMSPTKPPTDDPTFRPSPRPSAPPTDDPTFRPTLPPSPKKIPTPSGQGGPTDWNYCTSTNICWQGQGDCDSDNHCAPGLLCGTNNCRKFHVNADANADCCFVPADDFMDWHMHYYG